MPGSIVSIIEITVSPQTSESISLTFGRGWSRRRRCRNDLRHDLRHELSHERVEFGLVLVGVAA